MSAVLAIPLHLRRRTPNTILFQGDSITDCGRNRTNTSANAASALGTGYPLALTGMLRDRFPARDFQIYNRGVSGNTVPDLAARWTADTVAIDPAILSILIGVNDKWRTMDSGSHNTVEMYESNYRALLDSTRTALPNTQIVVMEPFVLHVGSVADAWFPDFDRYRETAARVAKNANATFVPLHDMFQDLAKSSTPQYWASDGVHPTVAGHQAIAEQWLKTVTI